MGSTSIEAIEFMTRLFDRFSVNLSLELIFNKPALSAIAAEMEAALVAEINAMSDAEFRTGLDEISN
jgi:hypothetical protein